MADLIVATLPGVWSSFTGTEQQLRDEGVVPEGLEFPERGRVLESYERADGLRVRLERRRPAKTKGPWARVDYWTITVFSPSLGKDASVHDAAQFCDTALGRAQLVRHQLARRPASRRSDPPKM